MIWSKISPFSSALDLQYSIFLLDKVIYCFTIPQDPETQPPPNRASSSNFRP